MSLPERGRDHDEILEQLETLRADDAKWRDGRTFGLVYDGGPEVHAIAESAAAMYLHENALNTLAMPSLGEIQRQVVGSMAELLHGDEAAGFMTSGGTESILMAVKSARERAREERGIERGEIVLADSAHAAFHKPACDEHLTGLGAFPVHLANVLGFAFDIEGVRGVHLHAIGKLKGLQPRFKLTVPLSTFKVPLVEFL